MLDSLRNLIKFCRFSLKGNDDGQFPIQQVSYLEKAADVFVIMPYGSHANVPEDFLGVMLQVAGQEQNRIVIPTSAKERIHPVESGEVVYFHPITKAKIHFKNNGDINIFSPADINVNCNNANITAVDKVQIDAPNIEMNSVNHSINTENYSLSATDTATSDMGTGSMDFIGDLTSNGKDISDQHTHGGVQSGSSSTDVVD